MDKQKKKCVSCDYATYKSTIELKLKDAKRGELCLYCTKHRKPVGERFVCNDWAMVGSDI